jgi:hypothetical protein
MNISKKRADDFLGVTLSPRRMESLLVEWANAATSFDHFKRSTSRGTAAMNRLMAKYPEFFDSIPPRARSSTAEWLLVDEIQTFLRLAWEATDLRLREWFIFAARHAYHDTTVIIPIQIAMSEATGDEWNRLAAEFTRARRAAPDLTPFERVAYHFHRISERARRCANPECPAPYFFAAKKGQKYCSLKCSAPSQRDQKRRWWRENRAKKGLD